MPSQISICNTALGRIGISELIEDIDDPNTRARTCKNLYDNVRDQVLEDFPWDFAQTVVALAEISDEYELGYKYRYGVPADCLRIQVVTDAAGGRWGGMTGSAIWNYGIAFGPTFPRAQYRVMANRDALPARMILCDLPEAYLWYTMRVEDPNQFSALFASAFAWKLASELALPLKADAGMAKDAGVMYLAEGSRAQVLSLSQQQAQPTHYDAPQDWLNARLG
jgi:hypothetical protein